MKLIYKAVVLEKEFIRMMRQYNNYFWVSAWAGINSTVFDELIKQESKIQKIIIGTHFYQTHPDFIETFLDNKGIRFITQPDGTFHPKTYLFYNTDSDWELLIGSANFTNAAFTKNTEASFLISSENATSTILKDTLALINGCWNNAKSIDPEELAKYRTMWKIHRPKLNSLSNKYGSKKSGTPSHEVAPMVLSWADFVKKIKADKNHGIISRLKVLGIARSLFQKVSHFNQLTEDERKYIAGLSNNLDPTEDWALFGSMKGAGIFNNRVAMNDENISLALDEIPLEEPITKVQYDNFISHFEKTFPGRYTATSSRLLAMKRPDVFFCLTSANQKRFCRDFDISRSEIDYQGYWTHIISRIFDSEWWINSKPIGITEIQINSAKAAFLDAIYYDS